MTERYKVEPCMVLLKGSILQSRVAVEGPSVAHHTFIWKEALYDGAIGIGSTEAG